MRKVTFVIDDIEYFKHEWNLSDENVVEIFGDTESFKVIYTIIGNGNNPDRYELSDFEGNKINLRGLNGYQRGVVLSDCMAYFIDGKCHNGSNRPHGVIKIEEKEI